MGTDYTFACARVRGNERSLINKDKMLVMIDAKTMEDACKVLQEAGYGEGEVILPSAYEKALEAETTKLYEFLHSIAPDAEELNIFRYPFDYHNIKTLLKAEFLGISGREILMSGGTVPADTLAVSGEGTQLHASYFSYESSDRGEPGCPCAHEGSAERGSDLR